MKYLSVAHLKFTAFSTARVAPILKDVLILFADGDPRLCCATQSTPQLAATSGAFAPEVDEILAADLEKNSAQRAVAAREEGDLLRVVDVRFPLEHSYDFDVIDHVVVDGRANLP